MAKTDTIKAKIRSDLKKEVEIIFDKLGLSVADATGLFYHQVKLWKGLPFDVRIPNKTTLKAF